MAMKLPVWLTKFRGIAITPLKLSARKYDGYGFNILTIEWQWKGVMCTQSVSKSLLHLNVYPDYQLHGEVWIVSCSIFYFCHRNLYRKVVKEPKTIEQLERERDEEEDIRDALIQIL